MEFVNLGLECLGVRLGQLETLLLAHLLLERSMFVLPVLGPLVEVSRGLLELLAPVLLLPVSIFVVFCLDLVLTQLLRQPHDFFGLQALLNGGE